jgi:hypothetical protein
MPRKDAEKNREYFHKWYKANRKTQYKRIKGRQKELKRKLREYKKTLKCEICGESHPSCIDFHHKDPKRKEAAIHIVANKGWSWKKIMTEIEKCQIVCANCHRKIHWKEKGE